MRAHLLPRSSAGWGRDWIAEVSRALRINSPCFRHFLAHTTHPNVPIAQCLGASRSISMAKPVVIVVGADKGGVGKTTVSRTLLDYFDANNIPTRAFDTESPRGTLKRFHPELTEIVDLTTTSDQMKIFDTLNAAAPSVTVIDVRAGLMSPSLSSLRY